MPPFWKKVKSIHLLAVFALSVLLFVGQLYLYTNVLHKELPVTIYLRHKNEALALEARMLQMKMDDYAGTLSEMEIRDEEIYRSIFGLNTIPESVRNAGLQGDNRYEEMERNGRSAAVKQLCLQSDVLLKKAYIQSKSYDEISAMVHSADQMANSIPAIWPVVPDKHDIHISSPFGYRLHPVLGYRRMHDGIDISMKPGNPIYATGDGVVEKVMYERKGYGRHVIINHGFGYKTLYAHCRNILVTEGIKVKRGEMIAESGNTGISNGPHLHYEIRYKGRPVNPYHYLDSGVSLEQYEDMIRRAEASSDKYYIHPSHKKKKKK